jgi:hypothetical protein
MPTVQIKNGKFYRDGIEEPAKFGDPDQIKALKRANEIRANPIAELSNYETVTYTATIKYTCPNCMFLNVDEMDEQSEWEFDESDMDELETTCGKCKHVYRLDNDKGTLKLKAL